MDIMYPCDQCDYSATMAARLRKHRVRKRLLRILVINVFN